MEQTICQVSQNYYCCMWWGAQKDRLEKLTTILPEKIILTSSKSMASECMNMWLKVRIQMDLCDALMVSLLIFYEEKGLEGLEDFPVANIFSWTNDKLWWFVLEPGQNCKAAVSNHCTRNVSARFSWVSVALVYSGKKWRSLYSWQWISMLDTIALWGDILLTEFGSVCPLWGKHHWKSIQNCSAWSPLSRVDIFIS